MENERRTQIVDPADAVREEHSRFLRRLQANAFARLRAVAEVGNRRSGPLKGTPRDVPALSASRQTSASS